jgi:O-antigen ligase
MGTMENLQNRARYIVFATIISMVLIVVPAFYDLTNIPKYSVLFIAAALALSCLLNPKFGFLSKSKWKINTPPIIFLVIMLILALLTDERHTAFFGKYGRNNGWLQYLSFVILFFMAAYSFNINYTKKFLNILIALGGITSIYGYLQYLGIDFINYAETGLPVIATLGNSNFASAFIGLSCIAAFWKATDSNLMKVRLLLIGLLAFELYVTFISESSQGLYLALLGIFLFTGFRFFSSNKRILFSYFITYSLLLVTALFGLLQIGPLAKIIYQPSITYRGDYFRAAWQMFESDIWTGVGIDRYGDYYRIFRDADATFRLGPSSVANYAHNVFLQLLATGGLFLVIAYLSTLALVVFASVKGFRKFQGQDRTLFAAIFAIWVAFQGQSVISIDQVTIATLGWVLSGILIALGLNSEFIDEKSKKLNNTPNKKRAGLQFQSALPGLSAILALFIAISWLVPTWQAEAAIKRATKLKGSLSEPGYAEEKRRLALNAVNARPGEINYKILASDVLVEINDLESARLQLKSALDLDPKSYESIIYTAQVYERAGILDSAIKLRITASQIDKYDTNNWSKLGSNLAEVGDFESIKKIIELLQPIKNKTSIISELMALLPKT